MTATIFHGIDSIRAAEGTLLGPTRWHTITQHDIDAFADLTGDRQWIHTDPERAANGPFGTTIAHGYLVLSLLPDFTEDLIELSGINLAVNYGLNKLRFPNPVPVNSRIRASITVGQAEDTPRGVLLHQHVAIEVDGAEKPALIADSLSLLA